MAENGNTKKAREIPSVFVNATPDGYEGETQIITKYFGGKGSAAAKFECKVARLDPITAGGVYANVSVDAIYQKATKNFWYEEGDTKVTIEAAIKAKQSADSIADTIKSDLLKQYTLVKAERTSEVKQAKAVHNEIKSMGMSDQEALDWLRAERARRAAEGK